jgi:perosamine synthetase
MGDVRFGEDFVLTMQGEIFSMIPVARPLLGVEEEAALGRVLASGQLAQGGCVAAFERSFARFCGVREAVAVTSGTAALHLALLAHGVGPGDEVITSAFSFAATANVILLVGAMPVFVDIEPETFTLDVHLVKAALTARTKALLPVHLYGHPCEMEPLVSLAERYRLALIEDACQAHAATVQGKQVGSFGTGCFSFYATKNITTGEGGMITTDDAELAERLRLLRNHGQSERYVHTMPGYNLRMTELQGALGVVQMEKLEHLTQQRIANAAYLTQELCGTVQTPLCREGYRHVYHQYTIRVPERRDDFVRQLQSRGIGTAIHYPQGIHQQPWYREHSDRFRCVSVEKGSDAGQGTEKGSLPETELAAQEVLSLPVHPALSQEDLVTITREVFALCN